MHGDDCADALDMRLVRARFLVAVAHWRLDDAEMASLLGIDVEDKRQPLWTDLDEDAETRMRLAIQVAHGLGRILDDDVVVEWLREAVDGTESPLAFMSRGATELRAMRAAAASRLP